MILDRLENADRYEGLLPGLRQAFDFLRRQGPQGLAALAVGRCDIDGDRVFAIAARDAGRGHAASPLEAHRRYADVQYVVAGTDEMGWRSLAACRRERAEYDEEKDIVFFDDKPETWLRGQRWIPRDGVRPFHEPAHLPRRARVDGDAPNGAFAQQLQCDLLFVLG